MFLVSGERAAIMRRRAERALAWARRALEERDHDTAAREAEYAAQLYLKSVILRISGEEARGHGLRELLGLLAHYLFEGGLVEEASAVSEYARKNRALLADLSAAHIRSIYGLFEYGEKEAKTLVDLTEDLTGFLRMLEERVFGGSEQT